MTEPDSSTPIDEINARLVLRTNKWHSKAALKLVHKITVAHHIMGYQLCTLHKIHAGEEKVEQWVKSINYCMWLTAENTKVTQHRWVSNKTVTGNYELLQFPKQLRAQEYPTEWLQVEDNN